MSQTVPITASSADRFALIIEGLCRIVAGRGGVSGLAGPLLVLIWTRLRRTAARFARFAATLPPPQARPAARRAPSPRQRRKSPLPRRKAWLLRLIPETASGASQLRHFLADPEIAALVAADRRLRRILRPLCHALGIRAAQALRPAPSPDPAPPCHPISSQAPPQAEAETSPPAAPPWTEQRKVQPALTNGIAGKRTPPALA